METRADLLSLLRWCAEGDFEKALQQAANDDRSEVHKLVATLERRVAGDGLTRTFSDFGADGARAATALAFARSVVDTLHEPLIVLDAAHRIVSINRAFALVFGVSESAILGIPAFDLADGAWNVPELRQLIEKALPDNHKVHGFKVELPTAYRKRVYSVNGRILNRPGSSDEIDGVLLVLQDVTARRRAEKRRRITRTVQNKAAQAHVRANPLLLAFLEAIPLGVYVLDASGEPLYANAATTEIFGQGIAPMTSADTGEGIYEAYVAGTDDAYPPNEQPIARALCGETVTRNDMELARPNGRMPVSVSAAPVFDEAGEVAYALAVCRDVTEERATERSLFRAQRMESVGRLAGGVAHDFNNALTIILNYAQFLRGSLDDPEVKEDLEQIVNAAKHAAQLTQQLLAFSRRRVVRPQNVLIHEQVIAVERLLRRFLGEDIALVTNLSDVQANVCIDPTALEQILLNLAVNARDAMPNGGTITLETRMAEIDESLSTVKGIPLVPGSYVLIAISDTGVGIPKDAQDRLFEPFFTTKTDGLGTGLGLAMCYGLVKQANGYIWVYSEVGLGTTFKIYLPRVDASPDIVKPVSSKEIPLEGTETILLVEDDRGVRRLVSRSLGHLGYTVVEATNAAHAIELADERDDAIDLLITDVVMPGMDGATLAEAITSSRPGVKVMYMSGYTTDAIAHRGVVREGVQLLSKPFTTAALALQVREVLDCD